MTRAAILSPCGAFRYLLQRGDGPRCAVIGNNPSTAVADADDPTSRKLGGFARDWGYPAYDLFNIGAGRATDPKDWAAMPDPYGPDNDFYLSLAAHYPLIVVAWGNLAPPEAVRRTVSILTASGAELYCLGTNANGSPKHPLYVPYSAVLRPWRYT
jgi:hypothetical protein